MIDDDGIWLDRFRVVEEKLVNINQGLSGDPFGYFNVRLCRIVVSQSLTESIAAVTEAGVVVAETEPIKRNPIRNLERVFHPLS